MHQYLSLVEAETKFWWPCSTGSWNDIDVGDMLITQNRLQLQWPPDGSRFIPSGSMNFNREIDFDYLENNEPALVVHIDRKDWTFRYTSYHTMEIILFARNRLWWVRCSTSGSA